MLFQNQSFPKLQKMSNAYTPLTDVDLHGGRGGDTFDSLTWRLVMSSSHASSELYSASLLSLSNKGALEVAGVIGTWVAAFFAIVALVGIIGPVLIWRASRTERHQALAAIGNDNHGFVSRGIHAGPSIWLLQRVRAPLLDKGPKAIDSSFALNIDTIKETASESSWVQFGVLVKTYGVDFRRGDDIEIYSARSFLPVHKLWLLCIGLVGRYGDRGDKGKLASSSRVVSLATPRIQRNGPTRARLSIDDDDSFEYINSRDRRQNETNLVRL